MENTARDFWKMIVDYKVSAIVMLCGLEENGEVNHYFYYYCIDNYSLLGMLLSILAIVK